MMLVEELNAMAEWKASRTLPLGEVKASNILEGRAALEIERLRAEIERLREVERKYLLLIAARSPSSSP